MSMVSQCIPQSWGLHERKSHVRQADSSLGSPVRLHHRVRLALSVRSIALSRLFYIPLILGMALSVSCGRGKVAGKKAEPSARITKRSTPAEFAEPQGFLDLIKHSSEPKGGFDANKAPRWNTDRFMSYISSQGVVLTDVNDSSNRKVSPVQLRSELVSRKGDSFKTFAHLAHIYSLSLIHI